MQRDTRRDTIERLVAYEGVQGGTGTVEERTVREEIGRQGTAGM